MVQCQETVKPMTKNLKKMLLIMLVIVSQIPVKELYVIGTALKQSSFGFDIFETCFA